MKKSPDESKKDCKSRLLQVQFQKYNEYFQIDQYTDLGVTYKQFVNNFPKIICTIKNINKRNNSLKTELLDVFSLQNWSSLNEDKKLQHSLTNCQGCFKDKKYKNVLAKLPLRGRTFAQKAHKSGLLKERALSEITNTYINHLNDIYKTNYNTDFVKQAKKHVPQFQQ